MDNGLHDCVLHVVAQSCDDCFHLSPKLEFGETSSAASTQCRSLVRGRVWYLLLRQGKLHTSNVYLDARCKQFDACALTSIRSTAGCADSKCRASSAVSAARRLPSAC